jgi:adenylate cyclase
MTEWQADLLRELSLAHQTRPAPERGTSDRSIEATFATILPAWQRLQQQVWRRHLLAAVERLIAHPDPDTAETLTVVGFADIANYTSTSRGLTATRLAEFIDTFTAETSLIITEHSGQVVKTIGDEVMFVINEPAAAAQVALTLAQRLSQLDARPYLHVGLAYGPALRHLGDYYGTVVNLASRLTSLARPGAVLIDQRLAVALETTPGLRIRRLRAVSLKGFSRVQPWLLRLDPA